MNLRILKKYPNRRLYDTVLSRYITLQDAGRLVAGGQEIQVLDSRTSEDITRSVLVQILLELERSGNCPLSTHLLSRLIAHSQTASAETVAQLLDEAVDRLNIRKSESEQNPSRRPNPHSGFYQPLGRSKSTGKNK